MSDDVLIRPACEADVDAIRSLFLAAYGEDYPFQQFYDAGWLKRGVYDDDTRFLMAEYGGRPVGTISTMFTAGGLTDLIGEFGRLVVDPDVRGKSIGSRLFEQAIDEVSEMILFGFAEARTAHIGSQKILERTGFAPVGFEPSKYTLAERESMVMYGRLFGEARSLRRNNPRVIGEAAPLAMRALANMGFEPDVIVVEAEHGFPTDRHFEIGSLSQQGWSPLLRIERGRVKDRDVFGNLSLSHGFFKIKTDSTQYLVARDGAGVLGGLGFTHDPIDAKVRIIELIGFSDAVKGRLLARAERMAREELDAVYMEADVSAYAPAIQRTLERLGFSAVAYCPSMVFEDVERLDVIRMGKLMAPYFHETIPLTDAAGAMRDLIEESMAYRRTGEEVVSAARATALFRDLEMGDFFHLARIARVRTVEAGATLIEQSGPADRLFIVESGALRVVVNGEQVGRVGPGETVGEMALLDQGPRSADVVADGETRVVEIMSDDLTRVMSDRPRLGLAVMRNLGADLSAKLRRVNAANT